MAGPRPRPMKQRTAPKGPLRRLSARERAAHDSTGFVWGSGGVPRDATLRTLRAYGIRGDAAEGVLAAAVRPLGHFRMEEAARSARLSRLELVQQAHDTAAMAEALRERVACMDPVISAWVVEAGVRGWGDHSFPESGLQYLERLAAAMQSAAAQARALPSKVPGRTEHRNQLLATTVDVVRECCPGTTKTRAREVAVALLECWGVDAPTDQSRQRRAAKRAK
jgi:hypothetical protein